jgi:hypothetical protein
MYLAHLLQSAQLLSVLDLNSQITIYLWSVCDLQNAISHSSHLVLESYLPLLSDYQHCYLLQLIYYILLRSEGMAIDPRNRSKQYYKRLI